MRGTLSEFTLAQLLQFMAIAERSGTITVRSGARVSRLLVDGDRVSGWGFDDFDLLGPLTTCELLPEPVRASLEGVVRRSETPGLSLIVSNLVEPGRWNTFVERVLEQEVYPLLNVDEGDFEIMVGPCPPAPLRFTIQVNSLILDGSRWESETEAADGSGMSTDSHWKRTSAFPEDSTSLDAQQWMVWGALGHERSITDLGRSLCLSDLTTTTAIRRLNQLRLVEPYVKSSDDLADDSAG